MTVSSQISRNVSTAAPGATVFPYSFKVIAAADLQVVVNGITKTLVVDYSISGVGLDGGGDVTFVTPMSGGETVLLRRSMAYARDTDYQTLGDLHSASLNNDQDAPVLMVQQLAEALNRSLQLPLDSTANGMLPALVPLSPLVVNAGGTGLEMGSTTLSGDLLLRSGLANSTTEGMGARLVAWAQAGAGAIKTWVLDELRRTVRPEHFGAVGNGVADDAPAINAAQAAANAINSEVVFTSGKTYRIGSALVYTDQNVSWRTDGRGKAVILQSGQAFDMLTVQGHLKGSQFMSASQTVNCRAWLIPTLSNYAVGDILAVLSSKSWYHDPRPGSTDARKSELHRVARTSGTTTIYTEDGANDGYNLSAPETVTLAVYAPVKCRIENMVFRSVRPAEAAGAACIGGINLLYCDEPLLENVDVEDCAAAGITLTQCYRPVVRGGHTFGANNENVGYGVQTAGTAHALVENRRFWQCRRGVDFSGAQIISRNSIARGNIVFGGGKDSTGTQYGYTDTGGLTSAFQYGLGSHGPADHSTYEGNVTAQLSNHYTTRGRNEVIQNNKMIGRASNGLIAIGFGENLTVRGNTTYDGWAGLKNGTVYDGGGAIETRRPDWFIKIDGSADPTLSYEGARTGSIVIEDNDVTIQNTFLMFYTIEDGCIFNNVSIKNNRVRLFPVNNTTDAYLASNKFGTSVAMTGWTIAGNDMKMTGGRRLYELNGITLNDNTSVRSFNRSYRLSLATDTATTIPMPDIGPGGFCRVIVEDGNTVYGMVRVASSSGTTAAFGTPALVTCVSSPTTGLAGTTGTVGNVNLCVANGLLYVENRLGSTRTILLTVLHAL